MNFAAVERVDLLEKLIGLRGVWTEAVRDEVEDHVHDPGFVDLARVLNFMPEQPHVPTGAELSAAVKIRKSLAKPGEGSQKHWGESEMMAIIDSRYANADPIVFTEDIGVLGLCLRAKIETATTRTVLEACYKKSWITRNEANEIAYRMIQLKRPVLGFPPIFLESIPEGLRPKAP